MNWEAIASTYQRSLALREITFAFTRQLAPLLINKGIFLYISILMPDSKSLEIPVQLYRVGSSIESHHNAQLYEYHEL